LADLVARVPSYRLGLTNEPLETRAAIQDLLATLHTT
jgi:hypothetical protein